MKSTSFCVGALLAGLAVAQPHRHDHARHHKRDQTTLVVTDWVTTYTTVDVTETIWVTPGFVAPAGTTSSTSSSSSKTPSTTSASTTRSTASPTAAQFFETNTVTPEKTQEPAPVSTSSTSTSSTTSTIQIAAPPASTPTSTSTSVSSYNGVCSSGSPCTGDITFYEAGLGACGNTNDGSIEKIVALPVGLMGSQSNGNPYCGKSVTISLGGKTTTAIVQDKCMGCLGDSIDLSNAAFADLADFSIGRTQAKWWFNN